MIRYEAEFDGSNRPSIVKIIEVSPEEIYKTKITFDNQEEKESLSSELLFDHINNIIEYCKVCLNNIRTIQREESLAGHSWHIVGWDLVNWCYEESDKWWKYAYFKDEEDEEEQEG